LDPRFDPLVGIDEQGKGGRYEGDKNLFVSFYVRAVLHPMRSQEAQRAIYVERDYIRIVTPGTRLTVIDAPVNSGNYMKRFGKQYEAWKKDAKDLIDGTPLEAFPYLFDKVGLTAELQAMNIRTVEQLANLADVNLSNMMGGHELRAKAQAFIEGVKGTDAQINKLQAQIAELQAQIAAAATPTASKK